MKKIIFSCFSLLAFSFGFGQNFKTPVDYLNYIGKETDLISNSTWIYTKTVAHSKNADEIEQTRRNLVQNIQNSSEKIKALKTGFKGDLDYRNQLLSYFLISERYINDDYGEIINLQEIADQSYDFMETYITTRDLINQKLNDEIEKLTLNQKNFGKKYNIQMAEDKSDLGKKMRISNEVFAYHTQMYLIFFKVNITDSNLSKAIQRNDLGNIQQLASSLELYADEGLGKIKDIKPYNKDASLLIATKKALEFYKKEAVVLTPKIINYLLLNQKIENIKGSLDNKAQKDRSFQEINDFNNLVNRTNKEIDEFNKLNSKFYQEKTAVNSTWEQTGSDFISKHVPKD